MKRRPPVQRDWLLARQKVADEGVCRNCKRDNGRLEAAHTLGREYDERDDCAACGGTGEGRAVGTKCGTCKGHGVIMRVDPLMVIPLCGPATSTSTCHGQHHARKLDLLPIMTGDEQVAAVRAIVERGKRIGGGGNIGIAEAFRRLSVLTEPAPIPAEACAIVHPAPGQVTLYDIIQEP